MTQQHSPENAGKTNKSRSWGIHPAPMIDSLIDVQRQFLEYAAEVNQAWAARAKTESELATTLAAKLAAARSVPDAAAAWQECLQQQMQLNAEEARRLLEQHQRFMRVGAEIFRNGGAVGTT